MRITLRRQLLLNRVSRGLALASLLFLTNALSAEGASAGGSCSSPRFLVAPAISLQEGSKPRFVSSADFNGDGKPDLVVSSIPYSSVVIFLSNGNGTFQPPLYNNVFYGAEGVAVGDFNRDGRPDLAVANSSNVSILLGNGDGMFQRGEEYRIGLNAFFVALGDFDKDGNADLVVTDEYSDKVWILMGRGDGTFQSPVSYKVGNGPSSVAVGDVNSDGKLDLVVANQGFSTQGSVSILLGRGDGSFQPSMDYIVGDGPRSIVMGDFNRDGRIDMAVVNTDSQNVSILLGNGNGTFQTAIKYEARGLPDFILLADLNLDEKPDLVIAQESSNLITILFGRGDGTFGPPVTYLAGSGPQAITAGDFNGDGKADLAVANGDSADVWILLGKGDGRLQAAEILTVGEGSHAAATGDFNSDGVADLAVANDRADSVSVLLGKGDGSFHPSVNYAAGSSTEFVSIADFNQDGHADMVVANFDSNNISIFLGKGDGDFFPAVYYAAGAHPYSTSTGDFNGDGMADVAVANYGPPGLSVLLGNGDGSFGQPQSYLTTFASSSVVVADFNGDLKADLAVNAPLLSIFLGVGNGVFREPLNISGNFFASGISVGDFNGDGKADLAIPGTIVAILLGRGDGTFQTAVNYKAGSGPQSVAIGDFNKDGKVDLAVANYFSDNISILTGNGDGTFKDPANYRAGKGPTHAIAEDFNKDGSVDLAVVNDVYKSVTVFLNSCSPYIVLSPATVSGLEVGTPYSQAFSASGGVAPYRYALAQGTLPPGLSFTSSGLLSGRPTTGGSFSFEIATTDATGGSTSQAYVVSVSGITRHPSMQTLLPAGGVATASTLGSPGLVQAGYAYFGVNSAIKPYGVAVLSSSQGGVVVSEAGVPASSLTHAVEIFVEYRTAVPAMNGPVDRGRININTGFAIINQGNTGYFNFQLRDKAGILVATGRGSIPGGAHRALFISELNQLAPDFILPPNFPTEMGYGSLTILSEQWFCLVALRLSTNQRGETLLTTTPVVDLLGPFNKGPMFFPQIADGGGFRTSLILMNPFGSVQSGTIKVFNDLGSPLSIRSVDDFFGSSAVLSYRIQPGGVFFFTTDGSPTNINTGSIQVIPDDGSSTPAGAGVLSYMPGGVLVTETGVPEASPTTHARIFIDLSNGHNTGLALAAPTEAPLHLTLEAIQADGHTAMGTANLDLSGNGHDAKFVNEFIPSLPDGFTGVLDISSTLSFAALTLRSLVNARGDYLITTFPVADLMHSGSLPYFFPQIADGGGYRTQFFFLTTDTTAQEATVYFVDDNGSPMAVGKSSR